MQKTLILDQLALMNLKNRFAVRLKEEVTILIETDAFIPTRIGGADRTWLAARIGATRQIFYARRGNPEVLAVLDALNDFLKNKKIASRDEKSPNLENLRLQTELILIKKENLRLKQQLRLALHELDAIHTGSIVVRASR
ncbi:hypothetical protein [Pseudomonas oryzihabitans]|uniref:hypothetical protein n=1 Tax=Pseudomonas oryzihabitans TaxID=47885 RepID=UPI0005C82114|nr:hypothetical protein [Pseudomonas oryzihabitans]